MRLLDASSITGFAWPESEAGRLARTYLPPILSAGMPEYVENAHGEMFILEDGDLVLPVVVTDANEDDTYVVSIHTQYSSYAVDELHRYLSPTKAAIISAGPRALGAILRAAKTNRAVYVNNWLVSTALFPESGAEHLGTITEFLRGRFPQHAIVFRSLNEVTSAEWMRALAALGYRFLFSRLVYIMLRCDPDALPKNARRHLRQDGEMFARSGYQVRPSLRGSREEADALRRLYEALYLEKYSPHNPQYTSRFFRETMASGSLRVFTLQKGCRVAGVMGYFILAGVLTAPIFGYDTSLPQSLGLYRMLSSATLNFARVEGLVDHASAGVGAFKRVRGYRPTPEYTAVLADHLPLFSRHAWRLLERYANRVVLPRWCRFDLGRDAPSD